MMNISDLRKSLTDDYQDKKRAMIRKELENHNAPTSQLKAEIHELKGYLEGVKKSLGMIEWFQNSSRLPIDEKVLKLEFTEKEVFLLRFILNEIDLKLPRSKEVTKETEVSFRFSPVEEIYLNSLRKKTEKAS